METCTFCHKQYPEEKLITACNNKVIDKPQLVAMLNQMKLGEMDEIMLQAVCPSCIFDGKVELC